MGILTRETWGDWEVVLRNDTATAEFQQVWPVAKKFYSQSFARELDRLLIEP